MSAPHRELELKAVVPDPEGLRRRLRQAGAALGSEGRMIDVRYDRDGELVLGDQVLRARTYRRNTGGVDIVLAWKGFERPPREVLERRADAIVAAWDLPARKWVKLLQNLPERTVTAA